MKRALLICALATAALAVPSAKADDFTISFDGGSLGYSGSGIFTGTNLGGGVYDLTGVLSGSVTDPGFGTSSIVSTSFAYGSDNNLFFPDPGTGYFDENGLSFTLANGVNVNLFDEIVGGTLFLDALESNPAGDVSEFVTETVTPYTPVAATPEPSSLTLLGSSALLGIGYLRRRFLA
jgi:hypothetical protein